VYFPSGQFWQTVEFSNVVTISHPTPVSFFSFFSEATVGMYFPAGQPVQKDLLSIPSNVP
jgi:hypothetical protein